MNNNLHAALFAMKCKMLSACIKDAIELDENCKEFNDETTKRAMYTSSLSSVIICARLKVNPVTTQRVPIMQEVANEILHQVNLAHRPPVQINQLCPQALEP